MSEDTPESQPGQEEDVPPCPDHYKGKESVFKLAYKFLKRLCQENDLKIEARGRSLWIDGFVKGFEPGFKSGYAQGLEEANQKPKLILPGEF